MPKYVCTVCGYVYDEEAGGPDSGIAPGTAWNELMDDWVCPVCGAAKDAFEPQGGTKAKKPSSDTQIDFSSDMEEMTTLELSALCSNLARGCEKQYKMAEAGLFNELSGFFKKASPLSKTSDPSQLLELIEQDLTEGFSNANAVASATGDRGALRALVWSEKVTRILKSLLSRYMREGDSMLENTEVYVCTICGFVFVGDGPPEVCPVCKVPNWKFEKVEGRAN